MRAHKEVVSVRILLVTCDFRVIETLCHFAQSLAVHIEACCDAEAAVGKLCHAKFEGVMVGFGPPGGPELLRKLPSLTANNSAISYAILTKATIRRKPLKRGPSSCWIVPLAPVELCFVCSRQPIRSW